jgi:TonB family protein
VPRDDRISAFQIGRTPIASAPDARPEPRLGAVPLQVELDAARRLDLARATAPPRVPSQLRGRTLPFGMLGSLAVHLSPLLLLLSWTSAPAEVAAPIPIELVLEQPPPPPEPKPEQHAEKPPPPPPLGRLASIDMGEPVKEPQPPASSPPASEPSETQAAARPPPPPDLVSALPKPVSPPEPLTAAPPLPAPAPASKPVPKPVVATSHPPKSQPARPQVVPGPEATRDEYLAYITTLINGHSNLLAPAALGGRSGVAVISIMVLGDGTIARLRVKRSSGYPDIDARVEQMVAAVRRFPPLPQWIQAPSVTLDYHRVFPDRFGEH